MNFSITGKKIGTEQPKVLPEKVLNPGVKPAFTATKTALKKSSVPNYSKTQNKTTNTKVINPEKKVEEKKKVDKLSQPPILIENKEQLKPKQYPTIQHVSQLPKQCQIMVRYNHYKDKFKAYNDILSYEVIEGKYTFARVFRGNYLPKLNKYRQERVEPVGQPETALQYQWEVEEGKQYEIFISDDEEEENKFQRKVYIAPKQETCPLKKPNSRAKQLTEEMKKLSTEELGSPKHKQLLEQRALEEELYS